MRQPFGIQTPHFLLSRCLYFQYSAIYNSCSSSLLSRRCWNMIQISIFFCKCNLTFGTFKDVPHFNLHQVLKFGIVFICIWYEYNVLLSVFIFTDGPCQTCWSQYVDLLHVVNTWSCWMDDIFNAVLVRYDMMSIWAKINT